MPCVRRFPAPHQTTSGAEMTPRAIVVTICGWLLFSASPISGSGHRPLMNVQDRTLPTTCSGDHSKFFASFAVNQIVDSAVLRALPACGILPADSGDYLKLVNNRTGEVLASHGPFSNSNPGVQWNVSTNAAISVSHTGTYICKTRTDTALNVYELDVVAPIDLQCPNYMEIEVNQWASVVVNASGTEPIGISANVPIGSFSPVTVKQDVLMATGGQWNIHGNDKGLAIGSNVTVQWTASYNNTPCTPIEFDRLVLVHCEKARKPVQCNSTIFVYKNCSNFSSQQYSPSSPPSTSFGESFSIDCAAGYIRNISINSVYKLTCLATGDWTTFPVCHRDFCKDSPCPAGHGCENTPHRPVCIPPCAPQRNPCHDNAVCVDTSGKAVCTCLRPFEGHGHAPDGCVEPPSTVVSTPLAPSTTHVVGGDRNKKKKSASGRTAQISSPAGFALPLFVMLLSLIFTF